MERRGQQVKNLSTVVEPHNGRVTVVISTRPNAWQAYADREMLCRRLGLQSSQAVQVVRGAGLDEFDDVDSDIEEGGARAHQASAAPEPAPSIKIVRLAPLNTEQVRLFAVARGVADVGDFIYAIERADADVFATRPTDLPGLIDVWKAQRRIGKYSEVECRINLYELISEQLIPYS